MRLDKLIEEAGDLRAALDQMEQRGKRKRKDDILVHAYVVRSHWRKYPVYLRRRKIKLVHGGKA